MVLNLPSEASAVCSMAVTNMPAVVLLFVFASIRVIIRIVLPLPCRGWASRGGFRLCYGIWIHRGEVVVALARRIDLHAPSRSVMMSVICSRCLIIVELLLEGFRK